MSDPETRLKQAAKQISIARETIDRPDKDAALERAEHLARGVAESINEEDDSVDPSPVSDGGRVLPGPNQEPDRTDRARMDIQQTHLSQAGWSR